MKLTPQERLQKALLGQATDRPPCICPGGMMNMTTYQMMEYAQTFWPAAHTDANAMARLAMVAHETGSFENYGLPFCMTVEVEAMGATVSFGSELCEPHVTGYAIHSVTKWQQIKPLSKNTGRVPIVLEAITRLASKKTDVPIIGNLSGPISTASSLVDPSTFYKELHTKKESAALCVEHIAKELLAFGLWQLEAGADCIAISDPAGTGEILGPRLFAQYTVPALVLICKGLKEAFPTRGIIVHICGNMKNVLELLQEIPCDSLSFDSAVSLSLAKKSLPGKVIMGNVSTYALEFSTPEKIAVMTRRCMKHAGVISPACGLGTRSPLVNTQAMRQAVELVRAQSGVK